MRRNSRRCLLRWREASDALKPHKCSQDIWLEEEVRYRFHKGCTQPQESKYSYTQSLLQHLLRCDESTALCYLLQRALEQVLIGSRMAHIGQVTQRIEARIDDWRESSCQVCVALRPLKWLKNREQGVPGKSSTFSSCLNFHYFATFPWFPHQNFFNLSTSLNSTYSEANRYSLQAIYQHHPCPKYRSFYDLSEVPTYYNYRYWRQRNYSNQLHRRQDHVLPFYDFINYKQNDWEN